MSHQPVQTSGPDTLPSAKTRFSAEPDRLNEATLILKSISHPMRLKLICTLGNDEFSVKELLARVGTTQTNISQHLGVLLRGKLIERRRLGNRHLYRIGNQQTLEFIHHIREVFCPRRNH